MSVSPIFSWELTAIARRERNYVTRWVYALCLLICTGSSIYSALILLSGQSIDQRTLAALNEELESESGSRPEPEPAR